MKWKLKVYLVGNDYKTTDNNFYKSFLLAPIFAFVCSFALEEIEVPEETHLSDLVTTLPSYMLTVATVINGTQKSSKYFRFQCQFC